MAFEDWEKNEDGSIVVRPLAGYDSFVPFGMMCGLRLGYVTSDAQLLSGGGEHLPLIMTPHQARELAEVLLRLADKAESPPSSGETAQ